MATLKTLVD